MNNCSIIASLIRKRRVVICSLFMLFLLLPLSMQSFSAAADNLLVNGSFEELDENGLPVGWTTDAYVLDEGYTVFSVDSNLACDGQYSATIRNIGKNDARFAQQVEVEPDTLYRFSGYFQTSDIEEGRGANLSIEGLYAFSESLYDTHENWTYLEWYGETGENQHSVTLFARLGGYSGESLGQVWFDQLCLEEVDVVPGSGTADLWYSQRTMGYYDDEEEDSSNSGAHAAWPHLIILSLLYALAAILIFQEMRRKRSQDIKLAGKFPNCILWIGLLLALILRLSISYFVAGYAVDVNCFTSWGATMAQYGPVDFYPMTSFCDYPPAYTYVLGLNALLCDWIPGLSAGGVRVIYRFFPAICDLLTCILLDRFLRHREPALRDGERIAAVLLLAFHPVTILNSAAWGQMDSALALLLMMVAIWAIEGKWHLCLPCYVLAVLVKPQALMLGFLGLCALLFAWINQKEKRRFILIGLAASAVVMISIVIPFGLHQDGVFTWIIKQYTNTLSSYPYATVNTANLWYLAEGNWNKIENSAAVWTVLLLAVLSFSYAVWTFSRTRKDWRCPWIEPSLSMLFSAFFVACLLFHSSWGIAGAGAMAFAFLIVISLYIRKGDICFLPYLGGLLFLLLYVFGVKMHERYIFPAFLLFALAFGLKRDRHILYILLSISITSFINEGIVLDNSIRLGSSLGHLNQDTKLLAQILAVLNCGTAVWAVRTGLELSLSRKEKEPLPRLLRDPVSEGCGLQWKKADSIALALIMTVYSCISLLTLGSTRAPQNAWTSSDYSESVILDLEEERESFSMMYFARVSRYDFSVSVSSDGQQWSDETWAQMDQGQCWKWKYVTESVPSGESRSFTNSRHWFSGRYIRITAHQINLSLCEVLFRDEDGNILPVRLVERINGEAASPLYSDPGALIDEQDSLEGLPVLFSLDSALEGEDNPAVAQPSWWNSTYFDEIYHARTAWEFLRAESPYETSHPPLGKVFMSWSISIFGMTPFGWRFAGAVAGILMLAGIYLVAKQLTKNTAISCFACCLLSLDCMHLTQTQIATIDSFPVLFILFAFFFMLRFLQTDWRYQQRSRILFNLGGSGLFMGLAIASKWIGIYAGAGLAVLFFWHCIRILLLNRRERKKLISTHDQIPGPIHSAWSVFIKMCLWCILFFVLIPLTIYCVSYLPYFASRHFIHLKDYFSALISSQQSMFSYHSTPGLGMDHPFYSPWYEWPVIGKPMFYATKSYLFNTELSFSIFCFGNPVIWWTGIPAMIGCVWMWLRNRQELLDVPGKEHPVSSDLDTSLIFLLVGFLSQYLPWTLVPRGTYIYHYFASIPFLILSISMCFHQIVLHHNKTGRWMMLVFISASLISMMLFFPYVTGIMAPVSWLDAGKSFLNIWY